MQPPIEGNEPVFSLWHSSHESAKGEYSSFPKRFKVFLALSRIECQERVFMGLAALGVRGGWVGT